METRWKRWARKGGVLLLAWLALAAAAQAEKVTELYEVEIPAADQSRQTLGRVAKLGLAELVVRVAGQREALEQARVREALPRAESYLRQFSYRRSELAGQEPQWLARLSFDPSLVDRLLRESGLPRWSDERPAVWVWIALDESGQRRFVPADGFKPLTEALSRQARRRGLPLRYPMLDLDDTAIYTLDEAWRLDSWEAQSAARRYSAEVVLSGRVAQLGNGRWLASWVILFDGQDFRVDGEAEDLDSLAAAPIDLAADLMAEKYAIAPVAISEAGLLMRVDGIRDFSDYAQVLNRVEALAPVQRAAVVLVEENSIVLRLSAEGELRQLQAALGTVGGMNPVASAAFDPGVQLHFLWRLEE